MQLNENISAYKANRSSEVATISINPNKKSSGAATISVNPARHTYLNDQFHWRGG